MGKTAELRLMHEVVGPAWLVWLEGVRSPLAMRQWRCSTPIVEIVHIVGFVILVGAAPCSTSGCSVFRDSCRWPSSPAPIALGTLEPPAGDPSGFLMFMAHATEWPKIPPSASNYC